MTYTTISDMITFLVIGARKIGQKFISCQTADSIAILLQKNQYWINLLGKFQAGFSSCIVHFLSLSQELKVIPLWFCQKQLKQSNIYLTSWKDYFNGLSLFVTSFPLSVHVESYENKTKCFKRRSISWIILRTMLCKMTSETY